MTTTARRQQLHKIIDAADSHKIEVFFRYISGVMDDTTTGKWNDPEFAATIERRTTELEKGVDKGYTWDEVKLKAKATAKKA